MRLKLLAGAALAASLAPPKVQTRMFEGTVPGATGSGDAFAYGQLTLNRQCGNDTVAVGPGYRLPKGGINVTGFGWTGPNRFQVQVANFNPKPLKIALVMYCLGKLFPVTTALAHFVLQLGPGAEGAVTKRCAAGFPVAAFWDLGGPYVGLRDSYAVGGNAWMFAARNQDPKNPATVEGDLLCVKGKGTNKVKVTYRPGSGGEVPAKSGSTPGTGTLNGGMCTGNEAPVGGGFKGLKAVELIGVQTSNTYQGFTMVNYGTLAISNTTFTSCLRKA